MLKDWQAVALVSHLDAAFERIRQVRMDEEGQVAFILRNRQFIRYAWNFLTRQPPFNDWQLNRDLDTLCEPVNQAHTKLLMVPLFNGYCIQMGSNYVFCKQIEGVIYQAFVNGFKITVTLITTIHPMGFIVVYRKVMELGRFGVIITKGAAQAVKRPFGVAQRAQ